MGTGNTLGNKSWGVCSVPPGRVVAAKIASQLPRSVDRKDLISYGPFGLLDALDKCDAIKQVKFETYAVTRIRGHIFDEIRGLAWVPRTVRAKARDVERAEDELHVRFGRPPQDAEIAESLGFTLLGNQEVCELLVAAVDDCRSASGRSSFSTTFTR